MNDLPAVDDDDLSTFVGCAVITAVLVLVALGLLIWRVVL